MKKLNNLFLTGIFISLFFTGMDSPLLNDNLKNFPEKKKGNKSRTASSSVINWKFETENKIYASAIQDEGVIYSGSDDGNFYAVNSYDGSLMWKYNTGSPIRSTANISGNTICFQSNNRLIGLNKKSGALLWEFTPEPARNRKAIISSDDWDYHHCSPVVYKNVAYYGNDFGYIYGVNLKNGAKVFEYKTEIGSPVRSTPAISDDIIYFGDFEGYLYALNLKTKTLKWSLKTYLVKEYDSFGGIVSKIVVDENNVYFGARNYNFQVLNKHTGVPVWKFTHSDGGWVSGTPYLKDGKVYVGGSDTHSLHVFEASTGKELGIFPFTNGGAMFSEPIFFGNYIIIQTGDGYDNESGKGFIYILDDSALEPIKELSVKGNIFSTSLLYNRTLYVTSVDGYIYAINLTALLKGQ